MAVQIEIVPDNLTVFYFPELLGLAFLDQSIDVNLPVSNFKEHISYYRRETDSFDRIVLSDLTIIQPVYARHLK